ncbi:hypothetical protein AAFN86_07580 [Roseomonas sp. CAU 1739]|uniref:hypothetical protein n=1 Tax=Roseomonas sp. CAU 1739 TaxID=3140364 RepID=UPI00325AC1A8
MAHGRSAPICFVLLVLGCPVAAQSPDAPALPRVIYGQTDPRVIYGPASPAPEPEPPRLAMPQAATAPPEQPPPGNSLTYGWEPAGPPIWYRQPGWRQPPPRDWGAPRPAPTFDNSFERPLPPGRYVGTPPGAARTPAPVPAPRWGMERR